ncbi:MAG: hypothetical protein M0Z46_00170 [Actinomycetota bacterium]|jgi:hypothetical protein|nr:hypothetical protein [Actinomycetota bacterium]
MATPAPDIEPRSQAVFIQDFVDVDEPEHLVSERLTEGQAWLARLAGAAGDEAEHQLVRLGPSSLGELITREIRVRLGPASTLDDGIVVPLRWEDARRPTLFPVLDGNLQVAPLGDGCSRLVLYASYRPPFDGLGRALDQALLHRVAESTIRSFLRKVAETLQDWPT